MSNVSRQATQSKIIGTRPQRSVVVQRIHNESFKKPMYQHGYGAPFRGAVQLKTGEIFRKNFVIEDGSGEVYFLPPILKGAISDGTPVWFDLADANYVKNVDAGSVTEQRQEQDDRVYVQFSPQSCGIEVVRMVYEAVTQDKLSRQDVKNAVGEIDKAGYDQATGLLVNRIPEIFSLLFDYFQHENWRFKAPKISYGKLTLELLKDSLGSRRPAVAILKNPNHVVVVDSVTGNFPNREIHYRDPDHGTYVVASERKFFERATGSYFTLSGQ